MGLQEVVVDQLMLMMVSQGLLVVVIHQLLMMVMVGRENDIMMRLVVIKGRSIVVSRGSVEVKSLGSH